MLGLAALEKSLRDLSPAIMGKKGYPQNILRNASRKMENKAKDKAKQLAPVDTGTLRDSMMIKLISVSYRDKIARGGDSVEFYYLGYDAGRKRGEGAYYGGMVEMGHFDRAGKWVAPQSFLRAAIVGNESKLVNSFVSKFRGDLNRVAKKVYSKYKKLGGRS